MARSNAIAFEPLTEWLKKSFIMSDVRNIEKFLNENHEIRETLNKFKEKFTLCEMSYKERLKIYLKAKHKEYKKESLTLNMNQIRSVLKFHHIKLTDDTLNFLFSTQDIYRKRGTKSAKVLRNAVTHKMTVPDMNEIFSRKDVLFAKMQEFFDALN